MFVILSSTHASLDLRYLPECSEVLLFNYFLFSFSNPQMGGNTIDELLSRGDSETIIQQQDSTYQK